MHTYRNILAIGSNPGAVYPSMMTGGFVRKSHGINSIRIAATVIRAMDLIKDILSYCYEGNALNYLTVYACITEL